MLTIIPADGDLFASTSEFFQGFALSSMTYNRADISYFIRKLGHLKEIFGKESPFSGILCSPGWARSLVIFFPSLRFCEYIVSISNHISISLLLVSLDSCWHT